jgi:hypothetical protein
LIIHPFFRMSTLSFLVIAHIFYGPLFGQRSSLTTAYLPGKKQEQASKTPDSLPLLRLVSNHQPPFSLTFSPPRSIIPPCPGQDAGAHISIPASPVLSVGSSSPRNDR